MGVDLERLDEDYPVGDLEERGVEIRHISATFALESESISLSWHKTFRTASTTQTPASSVST